MWKAACLCIYLRCCKQALEFAYTGELKVDAEGVMLLWPLAAALQVIFLYLQSYIFKVAFLIMHAGCHQVGLGSLVLLYFYACTRAFNGRPELKIQALALHASQSMPHQGVAHPGHLQLPLPAKLHPLHQSEVLTVLLHISRPMMCNHATSMCLCILGSMIQAAERPC